MYIYYIYIISLSPNISLYHYLFGADLRAVLLKEYHVRPNPDAFHGPRKERDALGCRWSFPVSAGISVAFTGGYPPAK